MMFSCVASVLTNYSNWSSVSYKHQMYNTKLFDDRKVEFCMMKC